MAPPGELKEKTEAAARGNLHDLGDLTRTEYLARKNDLLIERDQLEAQPAAASIARQRQQLQSVLDDWAIMTDEEKKRVLQMIFAEIRADHTADGLKIDYKPRPRWEPYGEAILGASAADRHGSPVTSERRTGLYVPNVETTQLVRDERGWLRLAS